MDNSLNYDFARTVSYQIYMEGWADMADEIGKDTPNSSLQFVKALTFQPA